MNETFDWLSIHSQLNQLAPLVLRTFPKNIRVDQDDIVQEVLLKLRRSKVEGRPGESLLRLMLKQMAIDRVRSRSKLSSLEHDLVDRHESMEFFERQSKWRALERALKELSSDDYVTLMKFYLKGVTISMLADENRVSYSAMATRLFRIKEKVRKQLEIQE